jgi:hypothetical protein
MTLRIRDQFSETEARARQRCMSLDGPSLLFRRGNVALHSCGSLEHGQACCIVSMLLRSCYEVQHAS